MEGRVIKARAWVVTLWGITKGSVQCHETGQRRKAWFRPSEAAVLVVEPELCELVTSLTALEILASQHIFLAGKLALSVPLAGTVRAII
jgi:hypothetical protein